MRRVLPLLLLVALPASPGSAGGERLPSHLAEVLDELEASDIVVLVPPRRPGGTTATVVDSEAHFYRLLFTNDPRGELSHAEQVNVFVVGTEDVAEPTPQAIPVDVRGVQGAFSCGAAACVLDWEEDGAAYSVGEFGAPEDAVAFAESLRPLDDLIDESPPAAGPGPDEEGTSRWLLTAVASTALAVAMAWLLRRRRRSTS